MWLVALTAALLLGVASDRALGAPAPTRLDDDETRSFWKGWLLLDDPALTPEDTGRKKGQITPKSVFIAPVIKDLPDCAPGYRADALGRCHRLVKIDQSAQLSFLLQKLNSMYASNDKFIKKSPQATTEGPLQVAIPLFGFPAVKTTTPIPATSTTTTTTEAPRTEEAEIVVVAAEVEVKDDENSTSIPGAIVTLWHLNNITNTTSNVTVTTPEVTEKTTTMELTSTPVTMEETTTIPPSTIQEETTTSDDVSTQTTNQSTNTESTISEETTTLQTETTKSDDESSTSVTENTSLITDDDLNSSTITETIPSSEPKNSSSTIRSIIPTTTDIPLLSVHKLDSDIKIIESSDLSSENSDEKPVTFLELTDPVGLTDDDDNISDEINVGHTLPITSNQGLSTSQTWDHNGQRLRWPPREDGNQKTSPSTQESGWSWGPWPTTQRPVYLNFWSNVPQIHDSPTRTRTVIRSRPHSRYPTSFTNRPGPFYYQELSGQDVANVFRQPWQHG